jgi:hypothetical protein
MYLISHYFTCEELILVKMATSIQEVPAIAGQYEFVVVCFHCALGRKSPKTSLDVKDLPFNY